MGINMKTAYILGMISSANKDFIQETLKEPTFVIGVKDTTYDVDKFMRAHPEIKLIKRYTEVKNPKYTYSDGHILQPAIIQWKQESK